jgi:primase-polymerase (primpol)-like protein
MSDFENESREALAGATPEQVDTITERLENTTPDATFEAAPKGMTASEELARIPQWVAWRYLPPRPNSRTGKPLKMPVNPRTGGNARVDTPSTWGTVFEAMARQKAAKLAGVGIVLTKARADHDRPGRRY